jgi:hypothetical protein
VIRFSVSNNYDLWRKVTLHLLLKTTVSMKKVAWMLVALVPALNAHSQTDKPARRFNMGIQFGFNYSSVATGGFDAVHFKGVRVDNSTGFRLGLSGDYTFTKHLSLAGDAALSFYGTKIKAFNIDNTIATYELAPMFELAASLVYKPIGEGLNPYLTLGPGYKLPITGPIDNAIQLTRSVMACNIGAGVEIKCPKFTVAPELRYSFGLNNISQVAGVPDVRANSWSVIVGFRR